jgi:hypothetical protein
MRVARMRSNPLLTSQILAVLAICGDRTINEQQTTNCKENPGLDPGAFFMPTLAGFLFVFAYLVKYLQKLIYFVIINNFKCVPYYR